MTVRARGLAPVALELATGETEHELRPGSGATVTGRLLQNGEPVAGVLMGLAQENHGAGQFVGEFTIGTDDEGKFLFPNVTPNDRYVLYGKMETLRGIGAVPARPILVGAHGSQLDVGTVEVTSGLRISGKVRLADGEPIPANTRLLLNRDSTWDVQVVVVAPDGSFEIVDLPAERVSVAIRISGYRLSEKNYSLDRLNPAALTGIIDQDIEDLAILLEPGEPDYSLSSRVTREEIEARQKKLDEVLRGVDAEGEAIK